MILTIDGVRRLRDNRGDGINRGFARPPRAGLAPATLAVGSVARERGLL
ncbi:MAG: hypothetical protein ACREM6_17100 [Vulcanimicrobiaceae bacterium]